MKRRVYNMEISFFFALRRRFCFSFRETQRWITGMITAIRRWEVLRDLDRYLLRLMLV
jgi:hypothetical protein